MYDVIVALVLGTLQGVTEFLPVSSSGHLVIAGGLFKLEEPGLLWNAILHLATTAAIIFAFRRDLLNLTRAFIRGSSEYLRSFDKERAFEADPLFKMSLLVIIASLPVCVIGFLFEERLSGLFDSPLHAGVALLATGSILWLSRYVKRDPMEGEEVKARGAMEMGLVQTFALIPGISRSGTTITCGMVRGIRSDDAARFSFMITILPLMGVGLITMIRQLNNAAGGNPGVALNAPLLIGSIAAAVSGYIAIIFLMRILRRGKLHYFSWYCWTVGLFAIIWQLTQA